MSEQDDLKLIERENLKAFARTEAAKLKLLMEIKAMVYLIAMLVLAAFCFGVAYFIF